MSTAQTMAVVMFGLVFLAIYLLPALIAVKRDHHYRIAIFALNLLLGWSGIVWIICLVWSLSYAGPRRAYR